MTLIWIALAIYAAVGCVYAILTIRHRWYLVVYESNGQRSKAAVITLILVLYCLVAWPFPIWQEYRSRRKLHRE